MQSQITVCSESPHYPTTYNKPPPSGLINAYIFRYETAIIYTRHKSTAAPGLHVSEGFLLWRSYAFSSDLQALREIQAAVGVSAIMQR